MKNVIFLLLIFILLGAGCVEKPKDIKTEVQETPKKSPGGLVERPPIIPVTVPAIASTKIIECGSDSDCFNKAATACDYVRLTSTGETTILKSIILNNKTVTEIRPFVSGECGLYQKDISDYNRSDQSSMCIFQNAKKLNEYIAAVEQKTKELEGSGYQAHTGNIAKAYGTCLLNMRGEDGSFVWVEQP